MDGKSDQERRAALVAERHWATLRQLAESQAIRAIGDSVCELLAGRRERRRLAGRSGTCFGCGPRRRSSCCGT